MDGLRRWLFNVGWLIGKELRCLARDLPLMAAMVFAFSIAIIVTAKGLKAEVANASVAVVDADQSALSRRLREAVRPPYFKSPALVDAGHAAAAMDRGQYIFVIDIPARFEADVLAGRAPALQVAVDATALTQAALGASYLQEILAQEILDDLHERGLESRLPMRPVVHMLFNPNGQSEWFTSVMQIINNITILAIILVGAAVIREREHGTIEHLLVMPVRPSEIAVAKIAANGAVILLASFLSLLLMVQGVLGVPVAGSVGLFMAASALYLFAVTALGVMLATIATSMPQFGLLAVPVFVIMILLSGSMTPLESMPLPLQRAMQVSPATHYVKLAQAVLYRGAGWSVVWPQFLAVGVIGLAFLAVALARFRTMLAHQG